MANARFVILLLVFSGCMRSKSLVNVGHDTAVPGATVEAYAKKHKVSEAEALKQILGQGSPSKESTTDKSAALASAGKDRHSDH